MSEVNVSIACQNELKKLGEVMAKMDGAVVNQKEIDSMLRSLVKDGLEQKKPNWFQMYNEVIINGMLSGLGTPLVNFASNMVQTLAKPTLGVISSTFKDKIAKREARALFSAAFEGMGQDMVFLNKGYQTGMPVDFELSPAALGMSQKKFNEYMINLGAKVDPRTGTVSPAEANALLKGSYDYITKSIPGPAGEFIRIPTRLTVGIDEYFKARLRNQKTLALISRKASLDEEKNMGTYEELFAQYKKKAFYTMQEPPTDLDSKGISDWNIKESQQRANYAARLETVFGGDESFTTALYDVRNYATDGTFQTKLTGILEKISNAKGQGETVGQTILLQAIPFLRTPWNLTLEGISYVPGLGIAIKPGVSKTSMKMRKSADGTEYPVFETNVVKMGRDEVAARQVVGFGMVTTMAALWADDRLTGSIPDSAQDRAQWQANGKQEFSIKVGDKWISYQRVEPFSTAIGLAADSFELVKNLNNGSIQPGKEIEETKAAAFGMLKSNILQKTFMQGFADLLATMESPQKAETFLASMAKRMVPAISNTVARGFDPVEREAVSVADKVAQRIPGLRQTLPESYALYSADPNNPQPRQTNLMQAATGFGVSAMPTEFQQRMQALGVKFSPKSATMSKVKMDAEELADYKRFINENASRVFGQTISNLERMPNKQVAQRQASRIMSNATKMARFKLMQKYPDLRAQIQAQSRYDKFGIVEE